MLTRDDDRWDARARGAGSGGQDLRPLPALPHDRPPGLLFLLKRRGESGSVRAGAENSADARGEAFAAALVIVLGVGLRLAFVRAFPTIPVSDFRFLLDFGTRLRDHGLAAHDLGWVEFNPGLPLVLSVLFRFFPSDPESAARAATAVVTGLTGLIPLVLWRPILALRWRLLAGLALALWPGQVFFSGVVAQENWALFPAIALACLGVRGVHVPHLRPHPVAAGLLYAAACAIRQELLIVLLPLVVPAAGVWPRRAGTLRAFLLLAVSAGLPLLLLAAERRAAGGRFAMTTEHGGVGLLGTVVPGAAADGWVDPKPYVAARRPELLRDRKALWESATGLALEEWRRRWRYNAFRAAVSSMRLLRDSDTENLYWSVGAAAALPPERRGSGDAFAARWGPLLGLELASISGLFVAALVLGLRRCDAAILLLAAAVLLKVAVQTVFSPAGRLMVPAIALELLAVALAASSLAHAPRRERAGFLCVALAAAAFLFLATPPLRALARRKDEPPLQIRQFPLAIVDDGFAECRIESGQLTFFVWRRGYLGFSSRSPTPGESARVTCELPAAHGPLRLKLETAYAPSGQPGHVVERVEADGRELLSRDLAGPQDTNVLELPLGDAHSVTVEILALRVDSGSPSRAVSSVGFEIAAP
jgi:hypothetical protein